MENHKAVGFLMNTGPDPLEKISYSASVKCQNKLTKTNNIGAGRS